MSAKVTDCRYEPGFVILTVQGASEGMVLKLPTYWTV